MTFFSDTTIPECLFTILDVIRSKTQHTLSLRKSLVMASLGMAGVFSCAVSMTLLAPRCVVPWYGRLFWSAGSSAWYEKMACTVSFCRLKKEEIRLSPMTKTPTLTENSKSNVTTQNATKNFDYSTIADRLRTVSGSNNSHPTGVVKPVYECSTFPLTTIAVCSKGHTFKNL